MATQVSVEKPSIQATQPADLEIELNPKQNRSTSIFTIESVESSPIGTPPPLEVSNSILTEGDLTAQGNSNRSNRNSLNSHRSSIDSHRNSLTEEMNRNRKTHKGKVYNILTLEDSVYHEESPFYGSGEQERPRGKRKVSEDEMANTFSETAIETKRHNYEYTHYVGKVS